MLRAADSRAAAAAVPRAEPDAGGELHVRGVHARVVGRRAHTASAPAASTASAGTPPSRPPKRPSAQAPKRPSAQVAPKPQFQIRKFFASSEGSSLTCGTIGII
eukprot:5362886-Prymnesium_polylepis.2